MQEIRLKIGKMTCVNCQNAIEKMTRKIDGVEDVSVSFVNSCGVFLVREASLRDKIAGKIKSLGYEILANDEDIAKFKQKELLKLRNNLILSAFISTAAMILMSFAMHEKWSSLAQFALGAVGIFYCGRSFHKNALKGLAHGNLDMNTLISLGSGCAFIYSVCVFLGLFEAHLYFAEASMIISFVLFGKFLEENAKFRAQNNKNALLSLEIKSAMVQNSDGSFISTSPSFIKVGDIVLVKEGEVVSVDGVVVEGRAELDMSALSGEFVPVARQKGDEIEAGALLISGILKIKATKKAMDSKLEVLKDLVFRASNAKMPIAKLVDRISAYFVGAILLLALGVFIIWAFASGANAAFLHASAVLLISCPCALGLATPIALVLALNSATKKGILIKNPAALETLRKVRAFIFDKTGTLTKNDLSIFAHNLSQKDLEILQKMEAASSHPVAKAIARGAENTLVEGEIQSFAGRGLKFMDEKSEYLAGNLAFLSENGVKIAPKIHAFVKENESKAPIIVYFARNKSCVGAVCLANEPRDDAKNLLKFLRENGLKSVILSGDNEKSVAQSAANFGVDEFYAQFSPEKKLDFIKTRQNAEICAFVGDGINDAAALSLANVSFAMNGGSDLAKSAGDFVLMRDELGAIKSALQLSRKTFSIIKQNLFWAFFYNALCIPLAAGAFVPVARVFERIFGVQNSAEIRAGNSANFEGLNAGANSNFANLETLNSASMKFDSLNSAVNSNSMNFNTLNSLVNSNYTNLETLNSASANFESLNAAATSNSATNFETLNSTKFESLNSTTNLNTLNSTFENLNSMNFTKFESLNSVIATSNSTLENLNSATNFDNLNSVFENLNATNFDSLNSAKFETLNSANLVLENANFAGFENIMNFLNALSNFTLSPHHAALAMCFSSLCVVLNSLRLRKF